MDSRPRPDVAFVFHGLRNPENLGAIARAMKNFGLSELVLAEPRTGPDEDARRMAVNATDLLDGMRVEESFEAALAPYAFVAGTTSRAVAGRPSLDAAQLVAVMNALPAGTRKAVLFGNEKTGLSDDDLRPCQVVVSLPTFSDQPSINVSQTAVLLAHAFATALPHERPPVPESPLASHAERERLHERMREVALAAQFTFAQRPDQPLSPIRDLLDRAGATEREVRMLLSLFDKLGHAIRKRNPGP